MAGYSKLYAIGRSGFDGINPIRMQIRVGDADRQWLEAHYIDRSIKRLGSVRVITPERPDAPESLLDACLAFFPEHFACCPSLPDIAAELRSVERLDFHLGMEHVPVKWNALRREAIPRFSQLGLFEANLNLVDVQEIGNQLT